jgi:hypothetical protein
VFIGPIEPTALLREPDVHEFHTANLRLPATAWTWLLRLAWLSGHRSQRAARDAFMLRVGEVTSMLVAATEDTLVVSHAGVMMFLQKQLRAAGFVGPRFRVPAHGQLYVFERPDQRSG